MVDIRVLRSGVVTPDDDAINVSAVLTCLFGQLRDGAVVVETSHGRELTGFEVWCVTVCDQRIGIGRVTNNQHFNIAAGIVIDGLALCRENRSVGFEQIFALHAWAAGTCAYQQAVIGVFECNIGVIGLNDVVNQRKRAVFQLHDDAFQRFQCRCNLK